MPPYYSLNMTIEEFSPRRNISLKAIYKALLIDDFSFNGKYPSESDENLFTQLKNDSELERIIVWNQQKLDWNFRLGKSQNDREGYQQFLLKHPLYNHCRVITTRNYISVIVPENEVTFPDFEWYEGLKSLNMELIQPLKELSKSVWATGQVNSIQTSPENGGYSSYRDIHDGKKLAFLCPFTIVDHHCAQRIRSSVPSRDIHEEKLESGILLESSRTICGREHNSSMH